ncbi:hypothetical protein EDEG_01929 [Edhazardia aedis USNM 41457]|uniref:Very-long-chain (3R)-3-hydroxyacyl-CoA dehydratase n=1 Tax=Edhazardia aedis (strain USNM 41457) TaxID=1003232 RepID=J8ZVS9_EDHAE|nr:hypothetical protein EDEG_01929 [Edhazardia aedis USNM 41457]|eukprot:EJW03773.1 hypothetical protein EDEG_01929 [Edhazardia aedis USNM 41457]
MQEHKKPLLSAYILVFNIISILITIVALIFSLRFYFKPVEDTIFVVALCQSFFLLELLNIKIGATNSTYFATSTQLASRLFIIWYVCMFRGVLSSRQISLPKIYIFKNHFALMGFCWFISDCIRYAFYTLRSGWLRWLRYNLFIILYPLGVAMEMFLSFKMISSFNGFLVVAVLWAVGFPFLYGHMIKQRFIVNNRISRRNNNAANPKKEI